MKSIVFLLSILFIGTASFAQKLSDDKVPASVKKTFKEKYASAQKVKWEMEKADMYEAVFTINGKEMSATFDKDGKWNETETEIKTADLPVLVSQALTKNFPDYKLEKEANIVDSPSKGKLYEVIVQKGNEKLEVELSPNGEVKEKSPVKAKEGKEKDEDKEKDKD